MYSSEKAKEYRTNTLIPLWVLLWKYVKSRFYRYCHTFWESFGGVSVFIILFLIHQINLIELESETDPETTTMMGRRDSLTRVFFSPFNNFTRRLMSRAESYLNQDSGVLPKQRWEFESIGYPIKFHPNFFKTSNGIAEVKFKSNGSVTTDLEYSIHVVTGEAKNNLNKAYNGLLRTITRKVEIAPSFLGPLQWAIDKSFIEQLSHHNINQKIIMSTVPNFIMEELLTLHIFMIICTILGPLPFYLFYSTRLIVERRSGMKELMKHSGIDYGVLQFSHVMEALLVGILYSLAVTLILKAARIPILPHSNFFIIFFTITFHFVNTMCFAFITTALSQDFLHADSLGLALYLSTFIFDFLWFSYKEYTFLLCFILPHAPIYYFWDEILYLEKVGVGTQIWNVHKCHIDIFSVVRVWVLFMIQLDVTLTLGWYLDLVRPGCYGIPKKWNFFVKKEYWRPENKRKTIALPSYLMRRDDRNFEKLPRKAEIALQILNVSKVYKKFGSKTQVIALDSVTFDCYKGEVTMLLGANGAGKTTLMHIVAGMFSPTEGVVYLDGCAVANKVTDLRHNVGLSMQRSICFQHLTVKENIMFFKKLKGKTKEGFSVEHLLKRLKLTKIADCYGEKLTEENKKCLQVACVLAGDADVLVLDEPTTGMDVEVRHRLWDLLMILRGHKTILMTTSCLEEANALGDRIAILDRGVLKCHGSPPFLKNIIGTSFTLSITIQDSSRLYDLKEMVDRMIPELECRIHDMRRIAFSFPTNEFQKFPSLLEALEQKTTDFGIILIDVGMFMEEVFSKFIDTTEMEPSEKIRRFHEDSRERLVGCKLVLKQILLLTGRLFSYLMMKKWQFLALRFAVPVLCLIIITLTTNYSWRHKKLFSHQISQDRFEINKLLYHVAPFRRSGLFNGVNKYPGVDTVFAMDIDREFSDPSAGHSNKETVGFQITDNYTRIFHPTDPGITSKSINMFSNIYMSIFMPHLNNTIRTTYETLAKPRPAVVKDVKSSFLCLKWTSWVAFLSVLPLTPGIILCIVERSRGIRDNHMMAGCTPAVHWSAKLLAHMIMFVLIILIPIIAVALLLDFDNTFTQVWFCVCVVALLLMFGLAFLTYLYFLSFFLDENVAISEVYIKSLFFGVILPILISVLEVDWHNSVYIAVPYVILMVVARLNPVFALGMGLAKLTLTARLNAFCKLNRQLCPDLEFDDEDFDAEVCCQSKSSEPFSYFESYDTGLFDLINLFIQFIVFMMLVLLLEYRIPQYLYEQFSFFAYKEPAQEFNASSVMRERTYVETVIRNKSYEENMLVVDNVHKKYKYAKHIGKKKKHCAVQGITYTTQLGECLAILGPKSAGKTALLNMLAGTIVMTRGNSCVNGVFIRRNRMKYIHKISLSSSTGGMDDFMTGAQNLLFLAKLSGYSHGSACRVAYKALQCMGLLSNKTVVSKYSSGCLHRLSLCSALVLAPSVAFVDEPMKKLDASSKPLVAKALLRLRSRPAALIVAETSMDWRLLQPVFDRIAIMAKGQFAVIGPAEDILESITKGYTARIKLKMVTAYRLDKYYADDESSESESETDILGARKPTGKSVMFAQSLQTFKSDFLKIFNTSRLCREHLCMLYYYIEDKNKMQRYSVMFKKLQELQEKYDDLIEDYYLSCTTIEDVFWRLEYENDPEHMSSTSETK